MDLQLNGKRALVTGSSIGIGEAIARVLADEGAAVAVHGRQRDRAGAVADDIARSGHEVVVVLGDVTQADEAERIIEDTVRLIGGLDILVNNAGGSADKHAWEDTAPSDFADAYNRNVLAAVRMTQGALPHMRRAGWGRIVNISSLAGMMPPGAGPDYSACKAALNNATVSLSKAVASHGITVNAISPGTILTPKLAEAFRAIAQSKGLADHDADWHEIEQAVLPGLMAVPVGKVGQADDIAHAVAFLCSPLAKYITGVNLRIDGGALPSL